MRAYGGAMVNDTGVIPSGAWGAGSDRMIWENRVVGGPCS